MTNTAPTSAAGQADGSNPNDVHLTINGKPVVAQKGDLIIKAADDNGEYIPRFCYHNRMEPVGMCRMCICEVDSGRGPQLTPTCMATVAEGMKVETESPMSKQVQEGIIELLLANHPLDCPVCDKGGECPLQDQSFSHGPGESRYIEEKRHYEKPIPISDLVYLDRERCILCDRCTRFADEVAGDALIHFTHRGNTTQVNTFPDAPFSSYFSGNTVQICPVGALTAKPYRFRARPWDLNEIESTCSGCATGCRIVVQSSRDEVVRYLGVDSEPVNWGWLCDKGRFGYEATNSPARVVEPHVRQGDALAETSWSVALAEAARLVHDAVNVGGPNSIAVLGGTHGTNEDAYAWARLAKEAIGTPNVYCQFGDGLPAAVLGRPRATIAEAAAASTIVLLGPDLKEELGVLYLRIRDAATRGRKRIIEFAPKRSGLSALAWRSVLHEPGTQVAALTQLLADETVAAQLESGPVVVIAGRGNLAESFDHTMDALDLLFSRVPGAKLLPAMRRNNVVGALQVGMQPGEGGKYTRGVFEDAIAGRIELLVLLGADPLSDHPDSELTRRAIANVPRILAIDTFLNSTSQLADVVLPAAAAGEKRGTHTNIEGRVSQVNQKVTPRGTAHPDWMIAVELGLELGFDFGWSGVDEITDEIAAAIPAYAGITSAALAVAPDGIIGGAPEPAAVATGTTPPVPDRNSYDFRLVVSRKMFDGSVAVQQAASMAPLAKPATIHLHPLDLDRLAATQGTTVKVSSQRGSVVLTAEPDSDVLRGTAWVPFNQSGVDVGELIDCTAPVVDVRIETLWIALDPLLIGDLTAGDVAIVLVKVLVIFVVGLVGTMLMVWFERKIIAGMQNRIGPNKAGPFGILQTLADGTKLFFKEDLIPDNASRFVFKLAPYLAFVPAFLVWSVIPLGGDFSDGKDGTVVIFGHVTRLQLADPPMGVLLLLALSSIAIYGIMLAGWSSGSKYPLLGSVRATAQMVSYEAALGLSLATVILVSGTLSTSGIVSAQSSIGKWSVIATGLLPFVIFLVAATAELNRPPFDLVEAEQELVAGFNTEYASIRFALFYLAEFMNTITMSAVIVTLFFGGPQPISVNGHTLSLSFLGPLAGTVWFLLKLMVFLYVYVWFRATLPRLRYDQLMNLGWKLMIPLALGWFMLLAGFRIGRDEDWNMWEVGIIGGVVLLICAVLLSTANRVSARRREQEGAMF